MKTEYSYKYILSFLFLILLMGNLNAQNIDINQMRQRLQQAENDKSLATDLYNEMKDVPGTSSTIYTLKATSAAVLMNQLKNPGKLLKLLKAATNDIDKAIDLDPDNLEARIIRYTIETKAPKIFIKHSHQSEDHAFIEQHFDQAHFKGLPKSSVTGMINMIKMSGKFNKETVAQMEKEASAYQ